MRESLLWKGYVFDSREDVLRAETPGGERVTLAAPDAMPRRATLPYLAEQAADKYSADHDLRRALDAFQTFARAYGHVYTLRVHPGDLTRPAPPRRARGDEPYVAPSGAGFVGAFRRWRDDLRNRRLYEQAVLAPLRRAFPHIVDTGFTGSESSPTLEYLTDRSEEPIPAQLESDGVNLTLFMLTAPYLVPPKATAGEPLCLAFEEPEAGTHPVLQGLRLDTLRRMALDGAAGRPVQVLATTHSPDVLRWLRPGEVPDVLRIVEQPAGAEGTVVSQLTSADDLQRVYALFEGNLGAAWYSGALGGVPARPLGDEAEDAALGVA